MEQRSSLFSLLSTEQRKEEKLVLHTFVISMRLLVVQDNKSLSPILYSAHLPREQWRP